MATQHDGTPTPAIVASHATQEAYLGRVTLLGTIGTVGALHALI